MRKYHRIGDMKLRESPPLVRVEVGRHGQPRECSPAFLQYEQDTCDIAIKVFKEVITGGRGNLMLWKPGEYDEGCTEVCTRDDLAGKTVYKWEIVTRHPQWADKRLQRGIDTGVGSLHVFATPELSVSRALFILGMLGSNAWGFYGLGKNNTKILIEAQDGITGLREYVEQQEYGVLPWQIKEKDH